MAINPAPMEQCSKKCLCLTGDNQNLAYDCAKPCPDGFIFNQEACDCFPDVPPCSNGIAATVTSIIKGSGNVHRTETTFYPSLPNALAGGTARVIDGQIEVWDGTSFSQTGFQVPYQVGDELQGRKIQNVLSTVELATDCNSL